MSFIRISVILVIALFAFNAASAQESDTTDTITLQSQPAYPDSQLLYAVVTKKAAKIVDSPNYSVDPNKIKGIYFLSDRKKFTERFGDKGQDGVVLITFRKKYLKKFLGSMDIVYPSRDKGEYKGYPGSQVYQ